MSNQKGSQGYNANIVQYFVLEYYQQVSMECKNDAYGSYRSLQDAKLACDSDDHCWGVYDEFCPNSPYFYLCPHWADLNHSFSCTILKTSN